MNRLSMAEFVRTLVQQSLRDPMNSTLDDWPRLIEGYHYCLMAQAAEDEEGGPGLTSRTWTHLGFQRIWPERPPTFIEDSSDLFRRCMGVIGE